MKLKVNDEVLVLVLRIKTDDGVRYATTYNPNVDEIDGIEVQTLRVVQKEPTFRMDYLLEDYLGFKWYYQEADNADGLKQELFRPISQRIFETRGHFVSATQFLESQNSDLILYSSSNFRDMQSSLFGFDTTKCVAVVTNTINTALREIKESFDVDVFIVPNICGPLRKQVTVTYSNNLI